MRVTSTNSRPPASAIGRGVVICQKDSPSGFMASVIICWWPTEMYTRLASSAATGTGNSVVIGRLWTIHSSSSARHHSMSWGWPKCASILRPRPASRRTSASVRTGSS